MNKLRVVLSSVILASTGCASERLYVKVIDDEGCPVANAMVKVGFSTSHALFGGGHRKDGNDGGRAEARTDTNGNAVVKFNCTSSDFGWHVEADGYYRSESHREHFKGEDVVVPPAFGYVILHEHEKHGEITLYRKKNPQPMYAYSREVERQSPIANGKYGFDLECFDWLPPHGKGKVADFYYIRDRKDIKNVNMAVSKGKGYRLMSFRNGTPSFPTVGDVIGRIEFDEKCGAYVKKCTGNENFPSTYEADTNKTYVSDIPIRIVAQKGNVWLHEGKVVESDEYMVIRSRVKCDEHGKIVSANYSKLIGPVRFGSSVDISQSVFNPRPNDTNLESDPNRNLYQGKKGRGMIP